MRRVEGHTHLLKSDEGAVVVTDPNLMKKVNKLRAEKKKFELMEKQLYAVQRQLEQVMEQLKDGNNQQLQ